MREAYTLHTQSRVHTAATRNHSQRGRSEGEEGEERGREGGRDGDGIGAQKESETLEKVTKTDLKG